MFCWVYWWLNIFRTFLHSGSTINLTCTIKYSPEPPAYIFWYHHDEVINVTCVVNLNSLKFARHGSFKSSFYQPTYLIIHNIILVVFIADLVNLLLQVISYDSQRGGVSVITEKGDITTSYLLIQNADLSDSGRYSCSPSNADVASVRVHVLNGNLDFSLSFPFLLFVDFPFKNDENPQGLDGITRVLPSVWLRSLQTIISLQGTRSKSSPSLFHSLRDNNNDIFS